MKKQTLIPAPEVHHRLNVQRSPGFRRDLKSGAVQRAKTAPAESNPAGMRLSMRDDDFGSDRQAQEVGQVDEYMDPVHLG